MKTKKNKQTNKPVNHKKQKIIKKKTKKRHTEPRNTPEILHICAYLYK